MSCSPLYCFNFFPAWKSFFEDGCSEANNRLEMMVELKGWEVKVKVKVFQVFFPSRMSFPGGPGELWGLGGRKPKSVVAKQLIFRGLFQVHSVARSQWDTFLYNSWPLAAVFCLCNTALPDQGKDVPNYYWKRFLRTPVWFKLLYGKLQ